MFKRFFKWIYSKLIELVDDKKSVKYGYPPPCKRRPPVEKLEFRCSLCFKNFKEYISYFPQLSNDFIYYIENSDYYYNSIKCNDCYGFGKTKTRSQSQGMPVTTPVGSSQNYKNTIKYIDIPEVE